MVSDAPGGVVIPLRAGLAGFEPHPALRLNRRTIRNFSGPLPVATTLNPVR